MPFFYKLMDYEKYRQYWIEKISLTVADFLVTCNNENHGNIIIIIVLQPPGIHKHIHEYEYLTYEDVPSNNIVDVIKTTFKQSDIEINLLYYLNQYARNKLENIIEQFIEKYENYLNDYHDIFERIEIMNNLYMHITCENFEQSIKQNGILHSSGYKIGDYEEDDEEEDEEEDEGNHEYKGENINMMHDDEYMPEFELFFEDDNQDDYNFNGGRKNKSKKNKSRKNKSRKNKSRKNKSRKNKSKKNKSRKVFKNKI